MCTDTKCEEVVVVDDTPSVAPEEESGISIITIVILAAVGVCILGSLYYSWQQRMFCFKSKSETASLARKAKRKEKKEKKR